MGRWPRFAGVVKLPPDKESGDLVVFAGFNRVLSGVLGGRVDTVTFCEKLRGDGLGSLGLSNCSQSMKKVACRQGEVGEFFYRKAAGIAVVAVLSNVSLGCWFWLAEISGLMARRGVDH